MNTVPFTREDIKGYLDRAIGSWRAKRGELIVNTPDFVMTGHYIDAFQSVRISLFGELLPIDGENDLKDDYKFKKQQDKLHLAKEKKRERTLPDEKKMECIEGYLLGERIKIDCDENQAKLLRAKLSDWLDEVVTTTKGS